MVKINFLSRTVIGAKSDEVAFVGQHKDKSELTKKRANRRVALADLVARLDGGGDVVVVIMIVIAVTEAKTDDGMLDPVEAPVIHEKIDAAKLREGHRFREPLTGEVGGLAIVAVAKIVNGDEVTVDFGPRRLG